MKAIDRESLDARNPDGFIAHLAGPKPEGGWRVVDLWESEAADAFYGSDVFQQGVGSAPFQIDTTPWPMHRVEVDRTTKQLS